MREDNSSKNKYKKIKYHGTEALETNRDHALLEDNAS